MRDKVPRFLLPPFNWPLPIVLCPNCNIALHDQHHQCGDGDDEDGDDISGPQLLDLPACEEISNSTTLTVDQ